MKLLLILVSLSLVLPVLQGQEDLKNYDFPVADGIAATVIGTPDKYKADLPEKIDNLDEMKITIFEDRVVPEVFWYEDQMRYNLAYQDGPAPLIFVIAGTGAGYRSTKNRVLQRAFYKNGYHVVCLSSPTYSNFIVTASKNMVPGLLIEDAKDLYHVMKMVMKQVEDEITVTEYHVTGYSLGAAQSAFVAWLDEKEGAFDFKKVYMVNPPVSLLNSVTILDSMLEENIPGGLDHFNAYFDNMMKKFSALYRDMGYIDFSEDYFYEVYRKYPPEESNLEALIGLSFRISSCSIVFTSDVMTKAGLIVAKNRVLSSYESLTDYFKVTTRINFTNYFDELLLPFYKTLKPDLTREAAIKLVDLRQIEDYLRTEKKIGLVTNEDDLILAPGELDYLRQVFGDRAKFYPDGGHCGNMDHHDNVEHMLDFFNN